MLRITRLCAYIHTMLECRYCRRPFPTTFARTQHLRQQPFCHRAYKRKLVALAMHTPIWQVDDPEEMPSDMEGHEMDAVDKADDLMEDGRVNEAGNITRKVAGWREIARIIIYRRICVHYQRIKLTTRRAID
jgi:hypothetical protein